jgi:hypothetical protein
MILEKIQAWNQAEKEAKDAVRKSPFVRWLFEVLDKPGKSPLGPDDFDEEYPRLRCYRGTGHKMDVKSAFVRSDEYVMLTIATDWKGAEVSSFDESEGCPGAPARSRCHHFWVPKKLFLPEATKKEFAEWAAVTRNKATEEARRQIEKRAKALGLKLKPVGEDDDR